MIKNKISLLLITCLMHIITIEIFSQDYCKNICYCCKDICCGCLYDNNKKSEEEEQELKEKLEEQELEEENKEEESKFTEDQEQYFNNLLKDFDKNIKKFDNFIFFEKPDSTDVREYTIVKDGTKGKNGILGEGAYGTVYKVKNKKGEIFALKKNFIKKELPLTWKNEIQALIKCRKCKNVIKIVDVYKKNEIEQKYIAEDNGNVDGFYYYIITELYDHGDLLSYISSIYNDGDIKRYYIILRRSIYQMINAVKQVHDKGIIHRDIKPENFFIGENDKLYLGDFGCVSEQYDGMAAGDFNYRCQHLLNYLHEKGEGLKQDENFNKLFKFLDIFALATSIFHLLTELRFWSLIDYNYFINKNITVDDKWKRIKDKIVENDISKNLSIFRYTPEEVEKNNDVDPKDWKEPEEYKNLDSNFENILKKVLLESNFETFNVVTIDDLINSAFYQGLKSLVTEEKNE